MNGDAERLKHDRMVGTEVASQGNDLFFRHPDALGHGAVIGRSADEFHIGAEIGMTGAAVIAKAASMVRIDGDEGALRKLVLIEIGIEPAAEFVSWDERLADHRRADFPPSLK